MRAAYERDNANSLRMLEAKRYRRGMRNPLLPTREEVAAKQAKQAEVIQGMLDEGKSQVHIARNLGVSATTVQRRIGRFRLVAHGA